LFLTYPMDSPIFVVSGISVARFVCSFILILSNIML
jgi:hypothetical protein